MSGTTDHLEAWKDRECERIMKATPEELAAEEGMTVEEWLEEGRRMKERVLARLRALGAKI